VNVTLRASKIAQPVAPPLGPKFTHAAEFENLSLAHFFTMTERNSKRLEFVLNVLVGQEVDVTVRFLPADWACAVILVWISRPCRVFARPPVSQVAYVRRLWYCLV
jgi:hypothetical protein